MSTSPIIRFFDLPFFEKQLFIEAAFWLILLKILVKFCPFKWISPHLGTIKHPEQPSAELDPKTQKIIRHITRSISRAGTYLPGEYVCLPRSIAAKMMLRRFRIPNTLYLGIKHASNEKMKAHAWLKTGSRFVTGKSGHQEYTAIAMFSDRTNLTDFESGNHGPRQQI